VLTYYLVCARFAKPLSTQELDGLLQKQIAFRTTEAIESVFIFEDNALNGISRHRRIQPTIFTCLLSSFFSSFFSETPACFSSFFSPACFSSSPSHDQTEVIELQRCFYTPTMNIVKARQTDLELSISVYPGRLTLRLRGGWSRIMICHVHVTKMSIPA
jgi:hypothetical protein